MLKNYLKITLVNIYKKIFIIISILGFTFQIIFIGNLFGGIIAYIVGNVFLHNLSYRIQIDIFPFLIVTIFSLTIAFFTIYMQTRKITVQNPVNGLRYE